MTETDYKGLSRDKIPWDPKIDHNKCTTCGKCVKFCHMNAFKTKTIHDKKKTIEINPNRCVVFCRGCENICPQRAISHPEEKETQKIIDKLRNNQRFVMSKPKILFICTHNSARSQMAEGLLRNMYGEKYEVFSAGTNPTTINPLTIKAMTEIGVDITEQYSKGLEAFSDTEIDLAVSVCENSAKTLCALCTSPLTMGRPLVVSAKLPKTKKYVVQGFEDPSKVCGTEAENLDAFCRIRDEIRAWITDYFANLKNV